MTNAFRLFCLVFVLVIAVGRPAGQTRQPDPAPDLVKRGIDLADRDRPEEGIVAIKRAISMSPRDVAAHAAYIRIATYYLNRYDDVRKEYEDLVESDPRNPVYPMALALGAAGATTAAVNRARYETVSTLTPDSSWGHYAKAQLLLTEQPELAATELEESLKQDPTLADAYVGLIALQERRLGKLDDAIATAEKMAVQPELRPSGLVTLWRLRLARSKGSEDARQNLRTELQRVSAASRDVALLAAVRTAYAAFLDDAAARDAIESRIRQIDATWIPQRGLMTFLTLEPQPTRRRSFDRCLVPSTWIPLGSNPTSRNPASVRRTRSSERWRWTLSDGPSARLETAPMARHDLERRSTWTDRKER